MTATITQPLNAATIRPAMLSGGKRDNKNKAMAQTINSRQADAEGNQFIGARIVQHRLVTQSEVALKTTV
jgi:hypothetical protein